MTIRVGPPAGSEANVRTMQIIAAALPLGVVMFGGIVCSQGGLDLGDLSLHGFFSGMLLGLGAIALVLSRIVPRLLPIGTNLTSDSEPEAVRQALLGSVQTRLIVSLAICEGIAFANLAAVMLEKSTPNLLMAVVLLVAMLVQFPTADGVAAKVESLERDLQEKQRWK